VYQKFKTQRGLLIAGITSITTCGAVGAYGIIVGGWGGLMEEIVGTTVTFGVASLLMMICAAAWTRRRWFPLGPIGCGGILVSVGLLLVMIWGRTNQWGWYDFGEWVAACCFCSTALALVALLGLADVRREFRWVRHLTIVGIATLVLLMLLALANLLDSSWGEKLMGVAGIGVVCGMIAVGVVHRLSRIKNAESIRTFELTVSLVCPRCAASVEVSVGRSRCPSCGLRFNLEIDEEQCQSCGYPLYKLASDRCPECGTRT